jgi:hypothetical protein
MVVDGVYRLTLESSFDGGVNWELVMQGEYRRVDAVAEVAYGGRLG